MALLGSAFALALHATPLFVFPVFHSGPFGGFGLSVLYKEPAISGLGWRFGLGAGDALTDALNFAAEAHTPLAESIGLVGHWIQRSHRSPMGKPSESCKSK